MRILITGSEGQLGHDLVRVLGRKHELYPFDLDLDITGHQKVMSTISRIRPDIVIHAAAYTDVDGCELNPDKAYQVNAIGTQNVVLACQKRAAIMVYISTDYVFDGKKKEPYSEFDQPNPLSVYGKSKLAGENYVVNLLANYYIVRTAWLYGKKGRNFVKTILKLADDQEELRVVNDQTGSPTYSYDLAQMIAKLVETGWFGIYHVVNSGSCSWYEFAKKILQFAGKNEVQVRAIGSSEMGRSAPRPAYSVLSTTKLQEQGFGEMRHYTDALKAFLKKVRGRSS